jgi:small subunit ribosomal protein S1
VKIIHAKLSGFCPGVKRAIDITKKALSSEDKVYTYGPLVHNERVIDQLRSQGAEPINQLSDAGSAALVIRAHGVSPSLIAEATARGYKLYDATCPRVQKAQNLVAKLSAEGKFIILVGESDHPEVKGIVAQAQNPARVIVVGGTTDLERLSALPQKVELVAQTTQTCHNLQAVAQALRVRGVKVNVWDTLCDVTTKRQTAAQELAQKVDVMIVVGSNQSANTRRLAQICRAEGVPTYLVASAEELDPKWFTGKEMVGITAGASAPEEMIEEVCGRMTEEILKGVQNTTEEQQVEPAPEALTTEEQPVAKEDPDATSEVDQAVEELYESSLLTLQEGQVVSGKVVRVDNDGVLVDVGYKSEGLIPTNELSDAPFDHVSDEVQVGQEIKVTVLKVDTEGNNLLLSKRRADQEEAWEELREHYENGEPIEGKVTEVVKGGLIVYLGLRAFMPASQVGLRYEADLSHYVGQTLKAKIIELEPERRRVILSHRTILEEERESKQKALWAELEEGQVRHGKVTKLTDFGAFVDLGGAEGLVHISEMAWSRVRHPSEVVQEGEEIDVKVLRLDKERNRISLGLKQVKPDPWLDIRQNFPVGTVHEGLITNILDFGAFAKLMDGVEGLVHISQLAPRHVGHPSEIVSIGQQVKVKVLDINEEARRISLSIKQVPPELQVSAELEETGITDVEESGEIESSPARWTIADHADHESDPTEE